MSCMLVLRLVKVFAGGRHVRFMYTSYGSVGGPKIMYVEWLFGLSFPLSAASAETFREIVIHGT